MSRSFTVTYDLHPPEDTAASDLTRTKTHEFAVASGEQLKDYYDSLEKVVKEAKAKLGEELTAWRDAVGNKEQGKEKNVPLKNEDDEEEEEDVDA
ncbi:hypothetical protein OE88DRAFT_1649719 [Heliocybe sulcata]|uniref:EKC/KEOPS complex subunit GON7 n=1 Tax=Heliocybe sulcata TaxID=5364 RepID=A0A5C3NHQ5_9AGAM|nr:hypothetical protein OE88DRAFT_1649719 [Heliocybe sulcata]